MRKTYEIPDTIIELFKNGETTYRIIDHSRELDNNESMGLFLECLAIKEENVVIDDGSQVILRHPYFDFKLCIDAGGLGDFFSHKFDVTKINKD